MVHTYILKGILPTAVLNIFIVIINELDSNPAGQWPTQQSELFNLKNRDSLKKLTMKKPLPFRPLL